MGRTAPAHSKMHRYFLVVLFFVLLVLFCALFMTGCFKTGVDIKLPEKYHGSAWECINPCMAFSVDDEGFCLGTLFFEEMSLSIEVALPKGEKIGQIFVIEQRGKFCIFSGKYKITDDCIVLTGEWSPFLEERYHQSYDKGECTLVFERVE